MKIIAALAILTASTAAMAAPDHGSYHGGGWHGGGHYTGGHYSGGWHGGGGVSFGIGLDVPVGGAYYGPAYYGPDYPYYPAPAYVAPAPAVDFDLGIGFGGGYVGHGHYVRGYAGRGGWHRR